MELIKLNNYSCVRELFSQVTAAMRSKNILISKKFLKLLNHIFLIKIEIYHFIKKYLKKRRWKKKKLFKKKSLILNLLKALPFKHVIINIKNLTRGFRMRHVLPLYDALKRYKKNIFNNKAAVLYDFIFLIILIFRKKLEVIYLLKFFSKVFSLLKKKSHKIFIFFIKLICTLMLDKITYNSLIKGVKFIINGKLKGKDRSSVNKIVKGVLPCQTIMSDINYGCTHSYTRYGTFGIKLWINYI